MISWVFNALITKMQPLNVFHQPIIGIKERERWWCSRKCQERGRGRGCEWEKKVGSSNGLVGVLNERTHSWVRLWRWQPTSPSFYRHCPHLCGYCMRSSIGPYILQETYKYNYVYALSMPPSHASLITLSYKRSFYFLLL